MSDLMIKVIELDNEINILCDIVNTYNLTLKELDMIALEFEAKLKERDYILTIICGMIEP